MYVASTLECLRSSMSLSQFTIQQSCIVVYNGIGWHLGLGGHRGLTGLICMAKNPIPVEK